MICPESPETSPQLSRISFSESSHGTSDSPRSRELVAPSINSDLKFSMITYIQAIKTARCHKRITLRAFPTNCLWIAVFKFNGIPCSQFVIVVRRKQLSYNPAKHKSLWWTQHYSVKELFKIEFVSSFVYSFLYKWRLHYFAHSKLVTWSSTDGDWSLSNQGRRPGIWRDGWDLPRFRLTLHQSAS